MNSRVFVSNLPKYVNANRLKKHFSKKGNVTDCKIIYTKQGESRCFGFVGFENEEEAHRALTYFNKSFFDTRRINVELSETTNSDDKKRPWSKYSMGSSRYKELHPEYKSIKDLEKEKRDKKNEKRKRKEKNEIPERKLEIAKKEDPKLSEFLGIMKTATESRTWTNEDLEKLNPTITTEKKNGESVTTEQKSLIKKGDQLYVRTRKEYFYSDSEDEDKDNTKNQDQDQDQEKVQNNSNKDASENPKIVFKGKNNDQSLAFDETVSDLDYLKSLMSKKEKETEKEKDREIRNKVKKEKENKRIEKEKEKRKVEEKQYLEVEETIGESGRLFVRNLPFIATEDDVIELFSEYGELTEVHISINSETKQSKGYGFVLFMVPENATKAFEELNNKPWKGRILHILPARKKVEKKTSFSEGKEKGSFGQQRLAKRRERAMKETSWSTIFLRSDTVAESISDRMGMNKQQLLDPMADDLALRLAFGETDIVQETKEFLLNAGIRLEAFDGITKNTVKSRTIILVKNIPFETKEMELRQLFGKFGSLDRVVLPPSKTVAIVEFLEPSEARLAFRKLCYRKFKNVPLYLEWAPSASLVDQKKITKNLESTDRKRKIDKMSKQSNSKKEKKKMREEEKENENENEKENENENEKEKEKKKKKKEKREKKNIKTESSNKSATLYVKNLSFKTTERKLRKVFAHYLPKSITIVKRTNNEGMKLSLGYGFIEFPSPKYSLEALKKMQGVSVHGRDLELQFSTRNVNQDIEQEKKKRKTTKSMSNLKGSKLLVKNIPFEATKREIRELFSAYGQVKSVRLPKKFDGSHRGFGFVELVTKQEALNAASSLKNTHLYGRHLVIEPANEEDSLSQIRKKRFEDLKQMGKKKK
ncbi:hypothetical protein M0812_11578 [Anaeramoeba flamelloides]|uniref:RRM domain-containing protein n=1 Tax=Anaeramoeba flamelloides TaxID=1746091 RepID=A0AAV7ZY22_9EUKA|nr:hypothetical protein M0812_11578 [Anaeramoeba flamelloides]